MNQGKSAILFFSRRPESEAASKSFCSSNPKTNKRIARALYDSSRKEIIKSGIPYFHIHEDLQKGKHFSDRLHSAVLRVFKQGFHSIIVIGNDCPQLKSTELQTAGRLLQRNQTVLGPTKDGGAYLIGFSRSIFEDIHWEELRWQKSDFLTSFIADLRSRDVPYFLLDEKIDIDKGEDLQKLIAYLPFYHVIVKILRSITQRYTFWKRNFIVPHQAYLHCTYQRGPPLT